MLVYRVRETIIIYPVNIHKTQKETAFTPLLHLLILVVDVCVLGETEGGKTGKDEEGGDMGGGSIGSLCNSAASYYCTRR